MFVGLILYALVLRGPFVVVSTVSTDLREDLQLSATAIGLLTSLPVLCFGLAAPGASRLIGRIGVERSILLSLAGVFVGVLVRSAGGVALAVVGTVLIGAAITIGNVVNPVLIGRDFRRQPAAVTGTYTAALNVGSMITLSGRRRTARRLGLARHPRRLGGLAADRGSAVGPVGPTTGGTTCRRGRSRPARWNRRCRSPPCSGARPPGC